MLRGMALMLLMRTGVIRLMGRMILDRRVPIKLKLILPIALLYVLSPVDVIPDMIPVLGWTDDIAAVLLSIALFIGRAPREVVTEHLRRAAEGWSRRKADRREEDGVIEGSYRVVEDRGSR